MKTIYFQRCVPIWNNELNEKNEKYVAENLKVGSENFLIIYGSNAMTRLWLTFIVFLCQPRTHRHTTHTHTFISTMN